MNAINDLKVAVKLNNAEEISAKIDNAITALRELDESLKNLDVAAVIDGEQVGKAAVQYIKNEQRRLGKATIDVI